MKKTGKTVTRADVAEAITNRFQITRYTAMELIEDIIDEISSALQAGESVRITGFGSFIVRDKNERIGRNPKTKKEAIICKRKSISFRASPILKGLVDFKDEGGEDQ